jgi:undecaprenyl-diphosphatase
MKTILACLLLVGAAFAALACLMTANRDRPEARDGVPAWSRTWGLMGSLGAIIVFGAYIFFNILEDVLEADPSLVADRLTYAAMARLRSPLLDHIMTPITELGDAAVVTIVAVAVAGWLTYAKAWRTLGFWITAIAGAAVINTVIKVALHRPRPTDLYHKGWDAFSFPSGHSTSNAVLYGFLAFLLLGQVKPILRLPIALGSVVLVTAIAGSRLYLGAHWFSDVAGGLTFGAAWIAWLGLFYLRKPPEILRGDRLARVALMTLVVAGGANIVVNNAKDLQFYQARAYGAIPAAAPPAGKTYPR